MTCQVSDGYFEVCYCEMQVTTFASYQAPNFAITFGELLCFSLPYLVLGLTFQT